MNANYLLSFPFLEQNDVITEEFNESNCYINVNENSSKQFLESIVLY